MHPERRQKPRIDHGRPILARCVGRDLTCERSAVVRVRGNLAGFVDDVRPLCCKPLTAGRRRLSLAAIGPDRALLETRAVRHEIGEGHGATVYHRHVDIGVVADVGIEIEGAVEHEAHDRCPGEGLRDGGDAEARTVRVYRPSLGDVRVAEALHEGGTLRVDDCDGGAGDTEGVQLTVDKAFQPRCTRGCRTERVGGPRFGCRGR